MAIARYPFYILSQDTRYHPIFSKNMTSLFTVFVSTISGDIAEMHGVALAHHSFGAFLMDNQSASKHIDPKDKSLYAQHVNMMNRLVTMW